MRTDFLPFARPSISEEDVAAVTETLRSGWITTGAGCAAFEAAICDRLGCGAAVAVTSGTAAMHLALHAFGVGPGDEVITPSMTWVSTVNLITMAGATPVFVDVDHDTLMVSPEAVEAAVTDRTRAIIPVDFAGGCVDIAPMRQFAADRGIAVIEDAAHAIGTIRAGGEEVGSRGTAIFSLHPIKTISSGEGGVLVTDDVPLADRVRRLRFHGLGVDAWQRGQQGRSPQAEVLEPGFKYNLPDMNAVLGHSQFNRLDELVERRAELANRYHELLDGIPGILPLGDAASTERHSWHLFIIRVDEAVAGMDRDAFMESMKAKEIGTGIHFRAAHTHQWYREHTDAWRGTTLPNTEWNSNRICSLPLFPDMNDSDVQDVVDAIRQTIAVGVTA
ncbi:MAG: aminotransferase class I/II-fold pyridoxal phosphate-dependent enzyme [Phycisphaerales bacterium]|jgi:UDP-4-amino-4-deoxy-L-arabinose-oxoglutarate aminotransferase|nr:aminotransferase class I/II-fold pyridoxal phosphate-dependent enzyme [Phycisphaerales bacterium]